MAFIGRRVWEGWPGRPLPALDLGNSARLPFLLLRRLLGFALEEAVFLSRDVGTAAVLVVDRQHLADWRDGGRSTTTPVA